LLHFQLSKRAVKAAEAVLGPERSHLQPTCALMGKPT